MQQNLSYRGYAATLSDEVEGDRKASYLVTQSPEGGPNLTATEPVEVDCGSMADLVLIVERTIDNAIIGPVQETQSEAPPPTEGETTDVPPEGQQESSESTPQS
jgi:hypothetical protein